MFKKHNSAIFSVRKYRIIKTIYMFILGHKIMELVLNGIAWYPYKKLNGKLKFKGRFWLALICCLFTILLFPIAIIGAIIGMLIEPLFIVIGIAALVAYYNAKSMR